MSITVPLILSLVVLSGKLRSRESQFLIKSHHTIMCLHAAVVWNTSVIDTDFILGTCVVKLDCCKANDGLGISHSVTHCSSSQKAHVHSTRRAKKKKKRKRENERGGGWEDKQEVQTYVGKNQMIIITRKEFVKRNEKRRSKRENLTNKQACAVVAQAPPGVYNTVSVYVS